MRSLHLSTLLLLGCAAASSAAHSQDVEPDKAIRFGDGPEHPYAPSLLPGNEYDPELPTPDALLGQRWGSRIASHDEILVALRTWAEASPRATMHSYGRTHEGRELVYLVITSEANHARLGRIRDGLDLLHDPRGVPAADLDRLANESPACAWMGYGIHGDEVSASDSAPLVAYHLIAGQDAEVEALLDDVVVILDPCLNPDGRERIRAMTRWMSGYRGSLDHVSLHRGRWPYGRGNHYLFDMNRDWMAGVCPETRGRWAVLQEWHPQLFVDAHEMGALDTFLFYPQEKPHSPHLPGYLFGWQSRFADDAATAFDARGWGYYTREWADAWYPGYSDSWGSLNGAIGMLYEQAGIGGQAMRRESGVIETYAESVHGQVVASLANLETLRANRVGILRDFLRGQREQVEADEQVVVLSSENSSRLTRLLHTLSAQGIEVLRAEQDFEVTGASSSHGEPASTRRFAANEAWVVPLAQPARRLVLAYFDLDPRIDDETLRDEYARLERGDSSRLYDVTAWDLARQTGVEATWGTLSGTRLLVSPWPTKTGCVIGSTDAPPYAWALDASDDASVQFVGLALQAGVAVHVADRSFSVQAGEEFVRLPRGSFLIRRHENNPGVDALIVTAAASARATVYATYTGRARGDDPDLGGGHFHLARRGRIAIVTGEPCSTEDFGHLWHHIDVELGLPATLLEAAALGGYDLRPYDVIVLPPGAGGVLADAQDNLDAWVRAGGSLIAVGSSAEAIVEAGEWTEVKRRRDVLEELEAYIFAAERQRTAGAQPLDLGAVWEGTSERADPEEETGDVVAEAAAETHPDPARHDAFLRRFMPSGALLRAGLDPHHWLTAGCGEEIAVLFGSSTALLLDGRAPVRFADQERIRMAGLLWPEARERLDGAVWCSQEGLGHGQVILFATNPVLRGSTEDTGRLFSNAVVLGPGLGARGTIGR